ncbi:iron uptake protein [Mitsuaria sp. GD03876]|uniref:iron uptake protein n=1 Tax=Mitsuaria sp. GD03876 TaxID=2975399 RepID=UPI00244B0149|nr:iron uptake protein [Mitsuaria sp. GD03876]MDH0864399.1 iron uptake protein [Mitsuaria sp. GD03876]
MPASTSPAAASRVSLVLPILLRIAAAVGGAYAFCWGFIALCLSGAYAAGMSFHDAEHLSAMLGLLLYLVLFCWAIAARSLARVWIVLLAGAGAMTGAASLIQRALA